MKNIQIDELADLIKNKIQGEYVLIYWNLDYGYSNPEVFRGDLIVLDGEYDVDKDTKIWVCLRNESEGNESDGFPIDFDYDSGDIEKLNNDHYQFSLYKI